MRDKKKSSEIPPLYKKLSGENLYKKTIQCGKNTIVGVKVFDESNTFSIYKVGLINQAPTKYESGPHRK